MQKNIIMIFLNKLIKNLFLISTLILNIKAATLNIKLPDNKQKNNINYDGYRLVGCWIFKLIEEEFSTYSYDEENFSVKVDGKTLKEPIDIEDTKTYDIEIVENVRYNIKLKNPLDSTNNNKQLNIRSYDLTFNELIQIFFKSIKNSADKSMITINYFKFCDGKLYEILNEANDDKKEITDLENFIFDKNKEYLLYFPLNINDECEIRSFGYYDDDSDSTTKEYKSNFFIPKNKTLKDMVDFYLKMNNKNKNNVKYYRKSKKNKKVHIHFKKNSSEKIEDDDCFKGCIQCCVICCSRCKDDLKKVKYENL